MYILGGQVLMQLSILDVGDHPMSSAYFLGSILVGIYEWLDNKVTSFTSQSDWWCKKMKPDLGYTYMFDDPTRQRNVNNEIEGCIAYRKSATTAGVACLDDIFCSQTLSFVCERCM